MSTLVAIPPRVEEVFKKFQYVPYTTLSPAACTRAVQGEDELVINAQGGFSQNIRPPQ